MGNYHHLLKSTSLRRNWAARGDHQPRGRPVACWGGGEPDRPTASAASGRAHDLRRAVSRWLSDGRSQEWSPRTRSDRQGAMARCCWWLENEEATAATLEALTPARIRAFLVYAQLERALV